MTFKKISLLLSCFILKQGLVAQVVPPPATQTEVNAGVNRFKYVTPYTFANSSLIGGGGGGASTNSAVFAYGYRNGNGVTSGRTNLLAFGTFQSTSNFTVDGSAFFFTNSRAGYYNIGAGYSLYSSNNNTYAVMVATNGVMVESLIGYCEYLGGSGATITSTNTLSTFGMIYIPTNVAISVYSDYTKGAGLNVYNVKDPYIFIQAMGAPGSGATTINTYLEGSWMQDKNANGFGLTNAAFVQLGGAVSGQSEFQSVTSGKVLALTVTDTLTAGSTNKLDINNPSVGDALKVHSSSSGVVVWTNSPAPNPWLLLGGSIGSISLTTATKYNPLISPVQTAITAITNAEQNISQSAVTISNLQARVTRSAGLALPGSTNVVTFYVWTNGVRSAFGATITSDGTQVTFNSGTSALTIPGGASVTMGVSNAVDFVTSGNLIHYTFEMLR